MELVDMRGLKPRPLRVLVRFQAWVSGQNLLRICPSRTWILGARTGVRPSSSVRRAGVWICNLAVHANARSRSVGIRVGGRLQFSPAGCFGGNSPYADAYRFLSLRLTLTFYVPNNCIVFPRYTFMPLCPLSEQLALTFVLRVLYSTLCINLPSFT